MQPILSKKKTEVHGLKSRRWTVYDKIAQYQGLLKLYNRDKKILTHDVNKDSRMLKKEICKLRHHIEEQRAELENAIRGDRQRLRNTLAEDQGLLLAYQNMHPKKVIEVLSQDCFSKKKYLDRIRFRLKQRTQELVDLKLLYADYEDRVKFEKKDKIPEEETAMIITAKVEDAVMKNDTALCVKHTYNRILYLLKKDAIYFDAVLRALQIDGYKQGRSILKLTEMGQLASEYLDDRKQEYLMLENVLKGSMAEREQNIESIKAEIAGLHDNVKYLIRRDSVVIMVEDEGSVEDIQEVDQLKVLEDDINTICLTFDTIKDVISVSQIEQIFPRFEDQKRQKERLQALVDKTRKDRDTLLNKSRHAEEKYNSLNHSMVETTMWYKSEKDSLESEISELEESNAEAWTLIESRGIVYQEVRSVLQQLAELLRNVHLPSDKVDAKKTTPRSPRSKVEAEQSRPESKSTTPRPKTRKSHHDQEVSALYVKPEVLEQDAKELLNIISKKLPLLVKDAQEDDLLTEMAAQCYEKFVCNMISSNLVDTKVKKQALIDEDLFEDAQVPTRFEVKRISAEICEKNAKSEFEI